MSQQFRSLCSEELSSSEEQNESKALNICGKSILQKSKLYFSLQCPKNVQPKSWISSENQIVLSKKESYVLDHRQINPIKKGQREVIIISPSIILNTFQQQQLIDLQEVLNPMQTHEKYNKVEAQNSTNFNQKKSSSSNKKIKQKKKAQLKKSNAYKNFANQFVNFFIKEQNVKDLLQKYKMVKGNYKNMVDNLKKKIIYQKRAQKLKDMQSMLNHENMIYSQILTEACERFINIYLKIVEQSNKMKDKVSNLSIQQELTSMILRLKSKFNL